MTTSNGYKFQLSVNCECLLLNAAYVWVWRATTNMVLASPHFKITYHRNIEQTQFRNALRANNPSQQGNGYPANMVVTNNVKNAATLDDTE